MKHAAFALALILTASPVYAQLGGIGRRITQAKDAKDAYDVLKMSEADERQLGEQVSALVRKEFGVLQDAAVTKYVTLVGTVMAQASTRPNLQWEFIVLDTDGVNAFAAPGGIVHITRGALGLIKSEAELAGVLGHELAHVTKKHTINSIKKNKGFKVTSDMAPGSTALFSALANAAYDNIVEKGFDRGDEEDADQEGLRLANKASYAPNGLATFLGKLAERNKTTPTRNGLFASHPETQGRIEKLSNQVTSEKLAAAALVQPRYASNIKFEAKPLTEVATVVAGTRGVAGEEKKEEKPEEEKKKKGFLGGLKLSGGKQQESTQASASAGGRAVGTDRHAKGGENPSKLTVKVTPAELEEFRKGIA
ncbi:MAG: M48 family metalloprotease [Acidobacteria bacterium]|nr:M48 family metalloprotease [Acidobacteriota bacterium]